LTQDSSSAQSRTVSVDDTGVRRRLADGSEEAVTDPVAVVNPVDGDLWTLGDFALGPAHGQYDPFGRYC